LRDDRTAARESFFLIARLFVFASVPIAIVLAAGGGDIVRLLFGDRYAQSGDVLALLGWNVILGFQIFLLWYGLLAAHHERRMAVFMALGLALNVGLNFWLISAYGPRGAAASLLVSDAFVLCAQLVLLHRKVFAVPLDRLVGKPLLAAVPAVVAMLALGHYSGLVAGIVAALLFMAGLLATRYISRAEWEPLTKPVMRVVSQVF
jgi:O-antigen/teichoic acid export membrane protein